MKRRILLVFCAALMLFRFSAAESRWDGAVRVTAKQLGMRGDAVLPVYAAPEENAWRGAEGKAAVSLKEPFSALAAFWGYDGSLWCLVEYSTSGGAGRVGWICLKKGETPKVWPVSSWIDDYEYRVFLENGREALDEYMNKYIGDEWLLEEELRAIAEVEREQEEDTDAWPANLVELPRYNDDPEDNTLVELTRDVSLTDDPYGKRREIARLRKGDRVASLCFPFEDSLWEYVCTEIDGRKACGFLPKDALRDVNPYRIEGTEMVIEEGVSILGATQDMLDGGGIYKCIIGPYWGMDTFGMAQLVMPYPAEIRDMLKEEALQSAGTEEPEEDWDAEERYKLTGIRLPSTLRLLGEDAIADVRLDTLVIPEGAERNGCLSLERFSAPARLGLVVEESIVKDSKTRFNGDNGEAVTDQNRGEFY